MHVEGNVVFASYIQVTASRIVNYAFKHCSIGLCLDLRNLIAILIIHSSLYMYRKLPESITVIYLLLCARLYLLNKLAVQCTGANSHF